MIDISFGQSLMPHFTLIGTICRSLGENKPLSINANTQYRRFALWAILGLVLINRNKDTYGNATECGGNGGKVHINEVTLRRAR